MNSRVAIACQGGGSQIAFTAGVLTALFESSIQDRVNLVNQRLLKDVGARIMAAPQRTGEAPAAPAAK